ncbi:MAG: MCP four helix bundle domain-containing protein, partial [Planctomycetota bacterium]
AMNFIKNMNIGPRLGLGFGLVILLLVAVALIGISRLNASSQRMDEVVNDRYVTVALGNTIKTEVGAAARNLPNALLAKPEDVPRFLGLINDGVKVVSEGLSQMEKRLKTPTELEIFKSMTEGRTAYAHSRDQTLKLLSEGKRDQAVEYLFKDVVPVFTAYSKAFDKLIELQSSQMDKDGKAAIEAARAAVAMMMALAGVAVANGVIAAFFITRAITRPIGEAVQLLRVVASGDLTSHIDVKSTDETGQLMSAIKAMNESLVTVVSTVRTSSDNIATGSSQIATGNADLSQRTEEQASNLQQTAASMEQLTSTVKINADTAREATQLASSASEVAAKGGVVVGEVVGTMEAITASSKKISDIISVIDGIAF